MPEIIRRIGARPSHIECLCPASWQPCIFPTDLGEFALMANKVAPVSTHDSFTETIRSMPGDGGGGVASYERIALLDRAALKPSTEYAFYIAGVVENPDGSIQEPLFFSPFRPTPTRI